MSDDDNTPLINFDDRPKESSDEDGPEISLQQKLTDQDHSRRFWSLILLTVGFFLAVIIDAFLLCYTKDAWVTEAFSKTIVPILAFVLGASINK